MDKSGAKTIKFSTFSFALKGEETAENFKY
jgi:hypothetical protein